MAVVSTSDEKTEPPPLQSFPSSPLISKPDSESSSDNSPAVSGPIYPSDVNYQSDSSVHSRSAPGYLRSEEYRMLFRLPADEALVQDFNCAFQESILLQGHMYLFARHICFYSNIFGFETKKAIQFSEITCVRKAKTAGIFPTAIEIVAGGKKFFFASFLSRDEAYRLIVDGWSQHTNGTEILIDHQDLKSEIRSDDNGRVVLEKDKGFKQQINDLDPSDRSKDGDFVGESKLLLNSEDEIAVLSSPSEAQENGEEDAEPIVSDEQFSSRKLVWKVEDGDAPKVPNSYTKVAESKFPVQVEEFFNLFFSDEANNFTDSFHRVCGDKDFRCTSWSEHAQFGQTREMSFEHPIKIYFGAKCGHCQEVQKFRVYSNSHLVIETSQEIIDVPYGDYFRVQGLWDVERDGGENCCILKVYVNVAFSKRTMWKGKIEQSTIDECREAYSLWLDNAHELLKQKNLEKLDVETSAPDLNPCDGQFEGHESEERSLKRLHDAANALQIPLVASDTKIDSPRLENLVHGGSNAASFSASIFKETLTKFSLYLRSQNHLPLVLVIASALILLMQLSIIVLLFRAPQVHVLPQTGHQNSIGSSRSDIAEAEAWLERRVHYLKDEMHLVEGWLVKMQHEQALLKEQFEGLEQLRKGRK